MRGGEREREPQPQRRRCRSALALTLGWSLLGSELAGSVPDGIAPIEVAGVRGDAERGAAREHMELPARGDTIRLERGGTRRAGPLLEGSHGAVVASRRLQELGLLPDHLPAQGSVPLEVVEEALREGALRARRVRGAEPALVEVARIAEGWRARLLEEFPGVLPGGEREGGGPRVLGVEGSFGIGTHRGAVAPGFGEYEPDRTGAVPRTAQEGAALRTGAGASLYWGEHLGFRVAGGIAGSEARLQSLELVGLWGEWRFSAGRSPVAYGPVPAGGLVLNGGVGIDAIQLARRDPLILPSVLRVLGPTTVHGFVGRAHESRHPGTPFLWGASAQIRPHPRVMLGVHRAAFFGGAGEERRVTFGRIVDMLIGRVAGIGFENQVVSASARVLLPTEWALPLTASLEWGSEDAAGAWFDVPGRVLGLTAPSLPGAPGVSVGMEFAHFGGSCCGNPSWYRHWSFPGSWALRDRPLGYPLGGEGTERAVAIGADLLEARVRLAGRGFRRFRGGENLYSPERGGRSQGMELGADWRVRPRWEVRVRGAAERGDGWSEMNLMLEGRVF